MTTSDWRKAFKQLKEKPVKMQMSILRLNSACRMEGLGETSDIERAVWATVRAIVQSGRAT